MINIKGTDSSLPGYAGGHALLLTAYIGLSIVSFLTGFLGKPWIVVPVLGAIATIPYFFIKPKGKVLISKAQENPLVVWLMVVFSSHCLVLALAYLVGLAAG